MKRLLALALSLSFIFANASAKDVCHFAFRNNADGVYSPDLDKIGRINRLEQWSANMRAAAYKDDPLTPTAARKAREKFGEAEEKFLLGESLEAVSAYRSLYRRVEGSALAIERYEKLLEAMKSAKETGARNYRDIFRDHGVIKALSDEYSAKISGVYALSREIKNVRKFLRKRYRQLGKDFDAYNFARMETDKLAAAEHCSPVCRQAIEEFKQSAGLASAAERELFKGLVGRKKGYSLKEVRLLFNSHPEAVLAARKKEFLREGFALFMKYANDLRLFKRMWRALANSKWGSHSRLVRVFRSVYDQRYLKKDSLVAKRIAHHDGDSGQKFELMLKETLEMERDKFWVNFSRHMEGQVQKTWDDLMERAKELGSPYYERMKNAAEVGKKLGPINRSKIKGVKRTIALVAGLGLGWGYVNFKTGPSEGEPNLIPLEERPLDEEIEEGRQEDDETVLIDYLSSHDSQLVEIMGDLMEVDRSLNPGTPR